MENMPWINYATPKDCHICLFVFFLFSVTKRKRERHFRFYNEWFWLLRLTLH